jgi:hypothetical protein
MTRRISSLRSVSAFTFACVLALTSACGIFGGDDDDDTPDGGAGSSCDSNSDCGDGFVCAGGSCQFEGSVGLGGACWASRDCATSLYCTVAGVCGPAGTGGVGTACTTGAECTKDLTCELYGFGGTCAEAGDGDLGQACDNATACISGLACGADGTCQPPATAFPEFTGISCEPDEAPFRVYFEIPRPGEPPRDFFRLPFPNDARVDADGDLDMSDFPRPGPGPLGFDLVDLYVDALVEDFTGFSSEAPVTFRFSSELDFDSVGSNGANIHYVDITDPLDSGFGDDRSRRFGYTTAAGKYRCQHVFTLQNEVHQPLLPGHTYAAYISAEIRSATGAPPAQDPDMLAVLGDTEPSDPTLARVWGQYANFRTYMSNEAVDVADVAGVTVFTVQDTTGRAERLHTAVQATALPAITDLTICDTGVTSPCDDGTGERACGAADDDFYEIHGKYTVPMYQEGTTPYETPDDGGGIVEVGGVPQQQGDFDVCFTLTIPKRAAMPALGWPLMVYAHGTGGTMRGIVGNGVSRTAATMADPVAVFSYDGVVHGARHGASTRDEDGLMFNVINPRAARDNNLQGAVDVMQALRIPQIAGGLDVGGAVGTVSFNPDQVIYFGHSQGGNVGIPAMAVDDDAQLVILSGAGSHLTDGILNKTSPVDAKAGLQYLLGEELGASHPLMIVWQTYFDNIDPVNYAPLLVTRPPAGIASKHVFMTWGLNDTFSPKKTLNATARTGNFPVANPEVEDIGGNSVVRPVSLNRQAGDGEDRTAACFQYQPDGYDGHFVSTQNDAAIADWTAFVESFLATGVPTVD